LLNTQSGDCIRVVHPLFQEEGSGSIPTSPLQLEFGRCPMNVALTLNREWHSRVPELRNQTGKNVAFAAIFEGRYFAVAIWGEPIARMLNGKGMLELRRMAIAPDAPKNTGSRMLRIMRLLIRKENLDVKRLISYQDTESHVGTIYKAAGWSVGNESKPSAKGWNTRKRGEMQTWAKKVRWEIDLF